MTRDGNLEKGRGKNAFVLGDNYSRHWTVSYAGGETKRNAEKRM